MAYGSKSKPAWKHEATNVTEWGVQELANEPFKIIARVPKSVHPKGREAAKDDPAGIKEITCQNTRLANTQIIADGNYFSPKTAATFAEAIAKDAPLAKKLRKVWEMSSQAAARLTSSASTGATSDFGDELDF